MNMSEKNEMRIEEVLGRFSEPALKFERFKKVHNPCWLYNDLLFLGFDRKQVDAMIAPYMEYYKNVLAAYRNEVKHDYVPECSSDPK